MGRGWAEGKQIGGELQREGPQTGRWRPGRERLERQRAMGGQSEKRSRLGEEGLECRRHLGKEEVLKARGKDEREKWGCSAGGGPASRGERTRGAGAEKQQLNPETEEVGDFEKRGWGLGGVRGGF